MIKIRIIRNILRAIGSIAALGTVETRIERIDAKGYRIIATYIILLKGEEKR
jgi:hypothetical protein